MSGYFKKNFSKKLSEETLILAFDASRQIAFFKDFDYLVMHQIHEIFRYPIYAE